MQINILGTRTNIVKVLTFKITHTHSKHIQRSTPQKKPVPITSNVAVFMILNVMGIYGILVKALPSPLPQNMDLAHGPWVSADLFFQKGAIIL